MYVREIAGQKLTLQVSGKLWRRSLIMRDIETQSEWSHLLGLAMAGPMQGKQLKPLVTDMVTWATWRDQHPSTTVLNMSRTTAEYDRDFYRNPTRFVFGFECQGKARMIRLNTLQTQPVLNIEVEEVPLVATLDREGAGIHLFERELGSMTLEFQKIDELIMQDKNTSSRWDVRSGKAIAGPLKGQTLTPRVGIMSFDRVWNLFHPDTKEIKH